METIFGDPISWAEGIESKLNFAIIVFAHIIVGIIITTIYIIQRNYFSILPIVLFTTLFPVMYLYCIRRLLKIVKYEKYRGDLKSEK